MNIELSFKLLFLSGLSYAASSLLPVMNQMGLWVEPKVLFQHVLFDDRALQNAYFDWKGHDAALQYLAGTAAAI